MVNNNKLLATEQRAKKKATADKLKATKIQRDKVKAIAKEKEAKMTAIAEKETAKAAQVEKDMEDLTQSMLEAHQGKDGKEKEPPRKRTRKSP